MFFRIAPRLVLFGRSGGRRALLPTAGNREDILVPGNGITFISRRVQYGSVKALFPVACLCCALSLILCSGGCITHAKSQEYYDNLIAAEPENAEAWCIRGMYYNNHNQYAEAMASCNRALELDPEYGLAWYLKGIILTNMDMTDKAALCFENATRYDPGLAGNVQFIVGNR